jgi:hypothetical protein
VWAAARPAAGRRGPAARLQRTILVGSTIVAVVPQVDRLGQRQEGAQLPVRTMPAATMPGVLLLLLLLLLLLASTTAAAAAELAAAAAATIAITAAAPPACGRGDGQCPPCAPVYSVGPFEGGLGLSPCGDGGSVIGSSSGSSSSHQQPEFKVMENGICTDGWEPIGGASGAYVGNPDYETCARAARELKLRADGGPFVGNSSSGWQGGRDEKYLPQGCYFYQLGYGSEDVEVFFGLQGSPNQADGVRKAICRRRAPIPKEMCCLPVTSLSLGHGGSGGLPFGNDMVLQHGQPAAIFGLAKAGATITVSYNGHSVTARANLDPWDIPHSPLAANSWRVELPPQNPGPAVGNITVHCAGCNVNSNTAIELSGVLWGDVYICSGQVQRPL